MKKSHSPIILWNTWAEWAAGAGLCAACFFFMWAYHDWWRAKPYSLLTANECFALAAMFGVSLSLSLGPLSRLTGRFDRAYRLRRPLGVMGAIWAGPHVLGSLALLPEKYDWQYYTENWLHLALGIAAAALLAVLAAASAPGMARRLGGARWRRLQSCGYLLLAVILVHYLVLGKIGKWIEWFQVRDLPAPQGTFWITLVGLCALGLKAADWLVACRGDNRAESA